MTSPSGSIGNIQALRAVAAVLVVFTHIDAIKLGTFGVDIFFVISGFVIAYAGHADSWRPFILKRIFRIVPLYWLGTIAVFFAALLAPRLLKNTTSDPADLLKSLFFVPFAKAGATVQPVLFLGWTLDYEMLFYSIFAAGLAVWRRHAVVLTTGAIGLLVAAGAVLHIRSEPLRFWTSPITLEFVAGMWLFVVWKSGRLAQCPAWLGIAGVGLLVAFMTWSEIENFPFNRVVVSCIPATAIVALGLSCEGKFRVPNWAVGIGNASYSLYLFHPYIVIPAQKLVLHVTHDPLAMAAAIPLMIAAAVGVALLSYRLIERPSNAWLRHKFLAPDDAARAAA
ncbi:MAG TPA: acyltransferase [Rhizomicrobium sp.]